MVRRVVSLSCDYYDFIRLGSNNVRFNVGFSVITNLVVSGVGVSNVFQKPGLFATLGVRCPRIEEARHLAVIHTVSGTYWESVIINAMQRLVNTIEVTH